MKYYEFHIKTTESAVDAVTTILYTHGSTGVMITNPNDADFNNLEEVRWDFFDPQNLNLDFEGALITGYFEEVEPDQLKSDIEESLEGLKAFDIETGLAEVTYKEIFPSEWENEWKKYFKPFKLGDRIVVKPSWETYELEPGDLLIEIDPGNAFGSGTHETTSLCIEMLDKYMKPTDTVVDVGCGSGILSIAAGKLGAEHIIAVDIDKNAVLTAEENLALNGLSEVSDVRHGDLLDVISEKADIVVANIIADVIVKLSDDIDKILKPDALFISSGLIMNKVDWVIDELISRAFEIVEVVKKGEWAVVVSKKKH